MKYNGKYVLVEMGGINLDQKTLGGGMNKVQDGIDTIEDLMQIAYAGRDAHEMAVDMLTDLRHWLTIYDLDFEELLSVSDNHMEAESDPKTV